MIIGIAELTVNNQRGFSDFELERLLKQTLQIYPLGEIYKKIKILESIPLQCKQVLNPDPQKVISDRFVDDLQRLEANDREFRRKNKVHALCLCVKVAMPTEPLGGILVYGSHSREGTFDLVNPFPQAIAHEIGHLFGLDHHHKNGTREWDIMHVDGNVLHRVSGFCPKNQEKIKENASWPKLLLAVLK